jgi:hypothetical protein
VQVHCDEGVAIRIDPESCAEVREGVGEALTGARTGQPWSRERGIPGADVVWVTEGHTAGRVMRVPGRPGVVADPGMCARFLYGSREISRSTARAVPAGPRRGGEEP